MAERPNRRRANKRKRRKQSKLQIGFLIFCIITLLIGVAVCVALFMFALQNFVPPRITGIPEAGVASDRNGNDANGDDTAELNHAFGMITAMNTFDPRSLDLLLLDSGRTERFDVTGTTTVRNRHGITIGFSELRVGQIVDVYFGAGARQISTVSLNDSAWERQLSGNFNIDSSARRIVVAGQAYTFSTQTIVRNQQGAPSSISQINPEDTITIVGYQDKIWSIRIDSGKGFIDFANIDHIIEGTVAIGTLIFVPLEEDLVIPIEEGTHRMVIEGQNIERFIRYVSVRQGQTSTVDLTEAESRRGTLQVISNVPTASVFINGELVVLDQTLIELEHGEYTIRLEHPGFIPVQQTFTMNQTIMRIELNLQPDTPGREIAITTNPTGAEIFLDGVFMGYSPIMIRAEFGNRTVVARMAGFDDRPLHFIADANSPNQYFLTLERAVVQQQEPAPPPAVEDLPLPDDYYDED